VATRKSGPPRTAAPFVPKTTSLGTLASAADDCRGCDLYKDATQAVFGAGKKGARVLLLGEQPGDVEDKQGEPFVGPAGRLLDRALAAAGIDRATIYLTNAVKHFKHKVQGKRRLHEKPSAAEVKACRPWLDREIELVKPRVIVVLGATAAQAVFGSGFKVTQHRGEIFYDLTIAPAVVVTIHPSALLRLPPGEDRGAAEAAFVDDLRRVHAALQKIGDG
jgi:uracil-DNA glycosylase